MKSTIKMLGIAFAASTALATAAQAQREGSYGGGGPPTTTPQPRGGEQQKQEKAPKGGATVMIGDQKIKISAAFAKAYQELVAAVDGNDTANIPAKVAAAHAAAQTGEERFLASQAQLKAAIAAGNYAEVATAIEGLISSGRCRRNSTARLHQFSARPDTTSSSTPKRLRLTRKLSSSIPKIRRSSPCWRKLAQRRQSCRCGRRAPAVNRPAERERRQSARRPVQARDFSSRTRRSCR